MKCRQVKRRLPLYIGRDLSSKKQQALQEHLLTCRSCQSEHLRFVEARAEIRKWLQQQENAWDETNWRQTLEKVGGSEAETGRNLWPWPFKPAVAYTLMILFAAFLTLLTVKPSFISPLKPGDVVRVADIPEALSQPAQTASSQEVVAVTLVSRESGLKVQWFFNRNFDPKEDTE
jgi:hypothetical protein